MLVSKGQKAQAKYRVNLQIRCLFNLSKDESGDSPYIHGNLSYN